MAQDPSPEPITDVEDQRYVKALSHPLRVRILSMLEERNASPVQLAEHLDATLGTVAYHVRTLERLGLIKMVATHQRRGATEHVYAVRERPRFNDAAWTTASPMTKHVMTASALSQIGHYATSSAAAGGFDSGEAQLQRATLSVDREGFRALSEAVQRWIAEAQQIAEAAERRGAADGAAISIGLVTLLFEALPLFHSDGQSRE